MDKRKGKEKFSRKGDWSGRVTLPEAGDQNEAGSIEQHLDMIENGPGPRGDNILHAKGETFDDKRDPNFYKEMDEDEMLKNYHFTMAETNREGDEMSGDEHSSGLQGGEPELEIQPHLEEDIPGEETRKEEDREKKGAA